MGLAQAPVQCCGVGKVVSWGTQVGLGASWGAALGQDVSSHAPHHGPLSWCPLEALFACLLAHPSSCPNKLKVMSCFLLACHGARHVCVCCANAATNTCLKSQNPHKTKSTHVAHCCSHKELAMFAFLLGALGHLAFNIATSHHVPTTNCSSCHQRCPSGAPGQLSHCMGAMCPM